MISASAEGPGAAQDCGCRVWGQRCALWHSPNQLHPIGADADVRSVAMMSALF